MRKMSNTKFYGQLLSKNANYFEFVLKMPNWQPWVQPSFRVPQERALLPQNHS